MTADDNAGPSTEGAQTPYRGGDLEAAARAARDRAAAGTSATSSLKGAATGAPPEAASPSTPDATKGQGVDDASGATSDPAVDAAVASAVAEAEEAKAERESSSDGILAFFRELPVLLAVAFLLAFLLRTFVVQVFYIPSGSMIPTLEINDRIVVEKVTYLFRDPVRGEVVVFAGEEPVRVLDDSLVAKVTRGVGQFLGVVPANARDFVKRVIGLPGDEVEIDENGTVFVNGFELDEPYAVEDLRAFGPFTVPEGQLFFLGDNRPHSADSRLPSSLGYVDMDKVVGRAMVIVWPFDHADGLGTPDYGDVPDAE